VFGPNLTLHLPNFVNTGAIVEASTADTNATFLATVHVDTYLAKDLDYLIRFGLQLDKMLTCEGVRCDSEQLQKFMDFYNKEAQNIYVSFDNDNNVDTDHCQYVYCNDEWFLAGCNVVIPVETE